MEHQANVHPPPLFKRQSSSSLSRRSSNTPRSPSLHASQPQSDPHMPQRFATTSDEQSKLINALEAEEEALVNSLSRKLEKLRAEKIELESTLEMEQEQLVNRLQRQLSQLLASQQLQTTTTAITDKDGSSLPSSPQVHDLPLDSSSNRGHMAPTSPVPPPNLAPLLSTADPLHPSSVVVLEALQTENDNLRNKLAEAENSANRANKINEIYRQELIDLRHRAGLDIADLIHAPGAAENYETYSYSPSANRARRFSNPRGGASSGTSSGGIRIPGASNSPNSPHSRSVSVSKSSYSPSISSALSPSTPLSSVSPPTNTTTPSTSYTTPQAPNSTPVSMGIPLPGMSSTASSTCSTPFGSTPSSIAGLGIPTGYNVPPPSLASSVGGDGHFAASYALSQNEPLSSVHRRLSNSRHGARIAETGVLKPRSPSASRRPSEPPADAPKKEES